MTRSRLALSLAAITFGGLSGHAVMRGHTGYAANLAFASLIAFLLVVVLVNGARSLR